MIDIEVQYCIDCHLHNWCSRHNEKKYQQVYHQLETKIKSILKVVTIVKNQLPSFYAQKANLSNLGLGLHRYLDTRTNETVVFPRHGAFQIKVNGLLIFSKLQSNLWPNLQKIIVLICEMKSEIEAGRDIKHFSLDFRLENYKEDTKFIDTYKKSIQFKINKRPQSSQFNSTKPANNSSKQNKLNPKRKNVSCLKKGGSLLPQRKSDMDKKTLILKDRRYEIVNTYCNEYQDFNIQKEQEMEKSKVGKIIKNQFQSPTSKKKIQFKNEVLYPIKPDSFKVNNKDKVLHLSKKSSKKLIIKHVNRQDSSPLVNEKKARDEVDSIDKEASSTPHSPKTTKKQSIRNRHQTCTDKIMHKESQSLIKFESYENQYLKSYIKVQERQSLQQKISTVQLPQEGNRQSQEISEGVAKTQLVVQPQSYSQGEKMNEDEQSCVKQKDETQKLLSQEPIQRKNAIYDDDQSVESCLPKPEENIQEIKKEHLLVKQQQQQNGDQTTKQQKNDNYIQPSQKNMIQEQIQLKSAIQVPKEGDGMLIEPKGQEQQYQQQQFEVPNTAKSIQQVKEQQYQGLVLDTWEPVIEEAPTPHENFIQEEVQRCICELQTLILLKLEQENQKYYEPECQHVRQTFKIQEQQCSESSQKQKSLEQSHSICELETPIQNPLQNTQNIVGCEENMTKQNELQSRQQVQAFSSHNEQLKKQQLSQKFVSSHEQEILNAQQQQNQQVTTKKQLQPQQLQPQQTLQNEQQYLDQKQPSNQQNIVESEQNLDKTNTQKVDQNQQVQKQPYPLIQQTCANPEPQVPSPSAQKINSINEDIAQSLRTIYSQSSISLTNQIHLQLNDIYEGVEQRVEKRLANQIS